MGRATAPEVAAQTGTTPATAYFHLKSLQRAGLVVEAFRRPTSRRPVAVFEPSAVRFELPPAGESGPTSTLVRKAVLAGLRQSMRGYEDAAITSDSDKAVATKIHLIQCHARLSPQDRLEVITMIEATNRFVSERDGSGDEEVRWSSLLYPVVPARPSRK